MPDAFLTRLETMIGASVLSETDRAGLRLRVLVDHLYAGGAQENCDAGAFDDALVMAVTEASRDAVGAQASRLVAHPRASGRVLAGLVARGGAAAAAALRYGANIDFAVLEQAAAHGDAAGAVALASSHALSAQIAALLYRRPEREVLIALVRNPACHLDRTTASWLVSRARHDEDLARVLLGRGPLACDLTPLFLAADIVARGKIMADARRRDLGGPPAARRVPPPALIETLGQAAMRHDRPTLVDALARDLRLSRSDVDRIVGDRGGEPLALLANVAGLPAPLTRSLLRWLAACSEGDTRFVALERLALDFPSQTARRIVAAVTGRPVAAGSATARDAAPRISDASASSREFAPPSLRRDAR